MHYIQTKPLFFPPRRPRSVSEVGSPSAPPILRFGPGQQWLGVFARDYQRSLHRGLRLPARWADGHHHSLPHLCHRGHRGSHHADLLRGPAGSALHLLFSPWIPLLWGISQVFPGDNRRGNNILFFSRLLTHFAQGFQPGCRGDRCSSVYVSWLWGPGKAGVQRGRCHHCCALLGNRPPSHVWNWGVRRKGRKERGCLLRFFHFDWISPQRQSLRCVLIFKRWRHVGAQHPQKWDEGNRLQGDGALLHPRGDADFKLGSKGKEFHSVPRWEKKIVVLLALFEVRCCFSQPGLLVGVPGMLSGLHQAHQLYGR